MNGEQTNYGAADTGCGFLTMGFALAAGWLVYGTLTAGFWVAVLWLALGLTATVGWIPVVGPFLYWWLATNTVMPTLMVSLGLTSTWLTSLALWANLAISIVCTFMASAILLDGAT